MAGVTDGGAPQRRVKAEPAPTTPDPIEIAMEAEAQGIDPGSAARQVLIKQLDLIQTQTQLGRLQIASERTGLVLKWLAGTAGLAVAVALATLVWQAAHARGLVIAPFSVPPELAARGLTGEVVASQVLDKLSRLQEQTSSARRPESIGNDWGRDLKVAIPSTGVSLGDLQTALRQWLGHETRVSGEIYRTPAGTVLAVRLAGQPAFTATGDEQDLDALAADVAEQILRSTQPYRYAVWLLQNGRNAEAIPFLRGVVATNPDPRERAWAWRGIARDAGATGASAESRMASLEAIRLVPTMAYAWQGLATAEAALGHREAAMKARRRAVALMPRDADVEAWGRNSVLDESRLAEERGDYAAALETMGQAMPFDPRSVANVRGQRWANKVRHLGLLHRVSEARSLAAAGPPADGDPSSAAGLVTVLRWRTLRAAEDWPGLVAMAAEPALVGRAQLFGASGQDQATSIATMDLAYARLMTGDLEGAAAILDRSPMDCDRCLIGRGQLAAAQGDAAGADRWFERARAATPSLPQAAFEWGKVKLARGDPAGALALFKQAHKLGPGWAEPLKFKGDALMAQGRPGPALRAYRHAAEHAPRWGRLHLKWGEALAKTGKLDEARAKWRAAGTMDLSAADRAALKAHGV